MISYDNKEIMYTGCPGCAYARHEFDLQCGIAYENERFILTQDWELPIPGFFIISPKRHLERVEELSQEEKNEIFNIADKTIKILRKNKICDRFNLILEEKDGKHLHIWIMPRHNWMYNLSDGIINDIGKIREYAKKSLRNEKIYKNIKNITIIVSNEFNKISNIM